MYIDALQSTCGFPVEWLSNHWLLGAGATFCLVLAFLSEAAAAAALSTVDYNLLLSECQNTGNVLLMYSTSTYHPMQHTESHKRHYEFDVYALKEDTNPLVA